MQWLTLSQMVKNIFMKNSKKAFLLYKIIITICWIMLANSYFFFILLTISSMLKAKLINHSLKC